MMISIFYILADDVRIIHLALVVIYAALIDRLQRYLIKMRRN